jgi:hypothetical protein
VHAPELRVCVWTYRLSANLGSRRTLHGPAQLASHPQYTAQALRCDHFWCERADLVAIELVYAHDVSMSVGAEHMQHAVSMQIDNNIIISPRELLTR